MISEESAVRPLRKSASMCPNVAAEKVSARRRPLLTGESIGRSKATLAARAFRRNVNWFTILWTWCNSPNIS